jgi:hypothetical protein
MNHTIADLDALPEGSIVLCDPPICLIKTGDDDGRLPGEWRNPYIKPGRPGEWQPSAVIQSEVTRVVYNPAAGVGAASGVPFDAMSPSTAQQVLLAYSKMEPPADGDWATVLAAAQVATDPDEHYGARKDWDAVEAAGAVLGLVR